MAFFESHATCDRCGLLQTGPSASLVALQKVAERHTKAHGHVTTAGLRPRKED